MKSIYTSINRYLLALLVVTTPAYAQPTPQEGAAQPGAEVPAAVQKTIGDSLKQARPDLTFDYIRTSPIPGVYRVKVNHGPTLYTTEDGRYFVVGDLYEVTGKGYLNLAEKQREAVRAAKLAKVPKKDMIIFSPKDQPPKASIMVFTDVDCYYCQKFHKHMPELNKLGIEVRYLAFPRAGIGSMSYKKAVTAWCAKDRQAALTALKNHETLPLNLCPDNPVADEFKLGTSIGVNGTPALVTASGRLMPGYMSPLQLAHVLGVKVDPAVAAEIMRDEHVMKPH